MEIHLLLAFSGLVRCRCENSAILGERKNVNLPGVIVDLPTLTEKDKEDILKWGVPNHIDMIALSFVCKGSDLVRLLLRRGGGIAVERLGGGGDFGVGHFTMKRYKVEQSRYGALINYRNYQKATPEDFRISFTGFDNFRIGLYSLLNSRSSGTIKLELANADIREENTGMTGIGPKGLGVAPDAAPVSMHRARDAMISEPHAVSVEEICNDPVQIINGRPSSPGSSAGASLANSMTPFMLTHHGLYTTENHGLNFNVISS
ncbi:hypothetical protein Tsubulata_050959 [Turnera subulata]|uniref:pyruvate kinase n=1 Tax=Turnera subulata TaxID=218843 RepID=A0A9Q0JHL7_9ROSI|nr:hypothetical protein Tsubulata_050959 [Turnera subulata]